MYIKNENLETIKKDFKGNLFKQNRFHNLYGKSAGGKFFDLLKWKLLSISSKKLKKQDKYRLNVIKDNSILDEKRDYIYWLGHASFLIQINGKKILSDPCLTSPPLIKRLSSLPIDIKDIKPDYILISHGHYDHLDLNTIKQFSSCSALIPLNMGNIIKKTNKNITIQEASWYQKYDINEKFEIFFLPSHHWHKRTISDKDKILWGSFLIKSKNKTIYFAGDTAYSKHFKDISEVFNNIDIALMPIGAYKPRWFMKESHINPSEAIKGSNDLKAKQLIPMHFGTFDLSDESIGEPIKEFKNLSKKQNVKILDIGEIYFL